MEYEQITKDQQHSLTNERILEPATPLSKSKVWELQSEFYKKQGPEAWSKGIVPQYVTTNPYIADIYAKVVFGYVRDHASSLQKDTTIYIMELAAGVGRFTFSFLKRFTRLMERSNLNHINYKYIITDFAKRNVDFWLNHDYLSPYFDSGVLDCAVFDMTKDDTITLEKSGQVLRKDNVNSPVILFANYAFDTLPQDTFYVENKELYEGRITLTKDMETNANDKSTSILSGMDYFYTNHVINSKDYYEEEIFHLILDYYKEYLDNSSFSLPITSLRCINRIKDIFGGDMILLASDKGYNKLEDLEHINHPVLSKHGSISLTVNFHGVELFFKLQGGGALHSIYSYENVTTSLFTLSPDDRTFVDTELAFYDYMEAIGADDFHTLKQAIVKGHKNYTTKQLLTFLRYTLWDARTFAEFYNTLLERIQSEEDFPREELVQAIFHIWDNYFPIGEDGNLAYCFGSLLAYFGYDYDAIQFFESSIQFYGEDASIYYEIALCYVNMEIMEHAFENIEKSLALEPDYEDSLRLKELLLESVQ